jgi:2,3-dihydroxybenzoate-AMP ligase
MNQIPPRARMIETQLAKQRLEEIENHILAHLDVDNCAYVAVPDPILGEKERAHVILRLGKEMNLDSLNPFILKEHKIAKFKLPKRLELIDVLPLTSVGKANKKQLREMITEKIERESNYGKQ